MEIHVLRLRNEVDAVETTRIHNFASQTFGLFNNIGFTDE